MIGPNTMSFTVLVDDLIDEDSRVVKLPRVVRVLQEMDERFALEAACV